MEVVEYYLAYLGKLVDEDDALIVKGGSNIYMPIRHEAVTQLNAVAVALTVVVARLWHDCGTP